MENDFDCSGLGEPADDTAQMYYDQCAGRLGEPIEVRELLAAVGCAPDVPDGELRVYHDATILDVLHVAGFFDDGHLPEVDLGSEQLVLFNSWGDGEDCSGGGQEELVEAFFVDSDAEGAMLAHVNHDQLCEPPDCGALPHVYLWATPRLEVAACRYGVCCR